MEWVLAMALALVGVTTAVMLALVGAMFTAGLRLEQRAHAQRLRSVAQSLGMEVHDDSVHGAIADHPAVIQPATLTGRDGAQYSGWVVRIGGLPIDLALRSGKRQKGQPRTGDPHLDRKWTVAATSGGVGRLSAPARHELERLRRVTEKVVLEKGTLQVETRSESAIQRLLPTLRIVVEGLGTAGVALELAERVQNDPLASVRATMLWHLAKIDRQKALRMAREREPASAEELMITGTLLDDMDRVAAVMDYPTVSLALATSACDRWLRHGGDPIRALDAMERRHDLKGLLAATELLTERPEAVAPMLERVPRIVTRADVDLRRTRPVLVAFARTFALVGGDACEPALLQMLALDDEGIRRVALQALKACGTVEAVPPLRALQEQAGALSGLRARAEETIQAIQGRSSGVVGGLAVVDDTEERGRLALAHREQEGRLALPKEP